MRKRSGVIWNFHCLRINRIEQSERSMDMNAKAIVKERENIDEVLR